MTALTIHKVTELPATANPNSLYIVYKDGYIGLACTNNPSEDEEVFVATLNVEETYLSADGQEPRVYNTKTLHLKCQAVNGKLTGFTTHISNPSQIINMFCNGYKLTVESVIASESTPGRYDVTFDTGEPTLNDVDLFVTVFTGSYNMT